MTARDDYDGLAWHAGRHERTNLGEQCAMALDEIDGLRGVITDFEAQIEELNTEIINLTGGWGVDDG